MKQFKKIDALTNNCIFWLNCEYGPPDHRLILGKYLTYIIVT